MKIMVLFFAKSREVVGKDQLELEIPEGEGASSLVDKLQSQYPELEGMGFRIAVNSDYVEKDFKLHEGDQVAVIPPISGG
jgi:molybdopterin synthase sulfur carrier subunit